MPLSPSAEPVTEAKAPFGNVQRMELAFLGLGPAAGSPEVLTGGICF